MSISYIRGKIYSIKLTMETMETLAKIKRYGVWYKVPMKPIQWRWGWCCCDVSRYAEEAHCLFGLRQSSLVGDGGTGRSFIIKVVGSSGSSESRR